MSKKSKFHQYNIPNTCVYCGKKENEAWFGADSDGDKICDECAGGTNSNQPVLGVWKDLGAYLLGKKRAKSFTTEFQKKASLSRKMKRGRYSNR